MRLGRAGTHRNVLSASKTAVDTRIWAKVVSLGAKACLLAVLLATAGAFGAAAQRSYEITPFGGTKFGGQIGFNPPALFTPTGSTSSTAVDYLSIKSSFDYGVLFDYGVWPGFGLEFMWNHQPTELRAHDITTNVTSRVGPASLDMYQWGFLWDFRGEQAKLKPFMAMGLGFTHFNTNGALTDFGNRFSYNIGGGVKYNFNRHVGLRLDVRYSPSRTTQAQVEVVDQFGDVFTQTQNAHAKQGQANLGVLFRF